MLKRITPNEHKTLKLIVQTIEEAKRNNDLQTMDEFISYFYTTCSLLQKDPVVSYIIYAKCF